MLLVIGGSGYLGNLVLPLLSDQNKLRIFDLKPSSNPAWEYIAGDVCDFDSVSKASEGCEAILFFAKGRSGPEYDPQVISSEFDVSVRGLYFAMKAAAEKNIRQFVYTSTLSVYGKIESRYFSTENDPPHTGGPYGIIKAQGEHICRSGAQQWNMNVNVLRLAWPITDEQWLETSYEGTPTLKTSASDVARAMDAALKCQHGFQIFHIAGDYRQKIINMSRAKMLLRWKPMSRPKLSQKEKWNTNVMKRNLRRFLVSLR